MPPGRQWGYWLYRSIWTAVDWLYPPCCGGCGKRGVRWCAECKTSVRILDPNRLCRVCGQGLSASGECPACQKERPVYAAARSWAVYEGPLRHAHHRLKYQRDIGLGDVLSEPLIDLFQSLNWKVDLVAPVPVGIARLRERGYNQSTLIARPLALGTGSAYRPQALQRTRQTRSQVDLTLSERKENVRRAFLARRGIVENRCVLVVDDIMTSGATLDACAAALLEAGAREVYCLTLARAPHRDLAL